MDIEIKPIQLFESKRLPARDDRGLVEHPDLAQFYDKPFNTEDEGFVDLKALVREGWEATVVELEFDSTDAEWHVWVEESDDVSAWMPTIPNGDGWVLAGIWDADDGPVAFYVREVVTA